MNSNEITKINRKNERAEQAPQRKANLDHARADKEADKLFKSNDPVTRQFMQNGLSDISLKAVALKSHERYLKADNGVPAEMERDEHVIKAIKRIPTKYVVDIIGYRPIETKDVRIAKEAIADRKHTFTTRLQSLAALILTPSEQYALMNREHNKAYQSALGKLGFVK